MSAARFARSPWSAALILALICAGACSSSVFDDLPKPVATFVAEYYPGETVQSYRHVGDDAVVTLDNSARLTFDADYAWTDIDGRGVTLPQVLVYDQAPAAVLQWLTENADTGAVYRMQRTDATYTLQLQDLTLTYTIRTGTITQTPA